MSFGLTAPTGGRGYYSTDSLHTRKITADYYPWESLTEMVYELQPNCVVHGGSAQNIRWVGNEEGYALEEHWSTVRKPEFYDKGIPNGKQWMRGHAMVRYGFLQKLMYPSVPVGIIMLRKTIN